MCDSVASQSKEQCSLTLHHQRFPSVIPRHFRFLVGKINQSIVVVVVVYLLRFQNYTERMNRTGRPVSPHVTIYAFPVAALASISTRLTGVMLSFGAFGIGGLDLVCGSGTSLALMQDIGSSGFLIAAPAKLAVGFPLIYHSLGALRHFVWDYFPDKYLNNEAVPKSSVALFGAASVLSLGLVVV